MLWQNLSAPTTRCCCWARCAARACVSARFALRAVRCKSRSDFKCCLLHMLALVAEALGALHLQAKEAFKQACEKFTQKQESLQALLARREQAHQALLVPGSTPAEPGGPDTGELCRLRALALLDVQAGCQTLANRAQRFLRLHGMQWD